jgi:hypothetical protein
MFWSVLPPRPTRYQAASCAQKKIFSRLKVPFVWEKGKNLYSFRGSKNQTSSRPWSPARGDNEL